MDFSSAMWNKPAADDEVVTKSLRFDRASAPRLSRTPDEEPTSTTKWTFSTWIKVSDLEATIDYPTSANYGYMLTAFSVGGGYETTIRLGAADDFAACINHNEGGVTTVDLETKAKYRDPASWLHLVVQYDSSLSTTARVKFIVNGVEQDIGGAENWPGPSEATYMNANGVIHHIAYHPVASPTNTLGHYLCDYYMLDGTIKAALDFAGPDSNGQWVPKATAFTSGEYGTNGFHLDFNVAPGTGDGAGTDVSGNDNHFDTETGLVASDQVNDRPTNNYCTLNPLDDASGSALSEGNLKVVGSGTQAHLGATMNMPISLKWYWEVYQSNTTLLEEGMTYEGKELVTYGIGIYSTNVYALGSTVVTGITRTAGDIIQFAVDSATGKVWVGQNNTWFNSGNPSTGANPIATITTPTIGEWQIQVWPVTAPATRIYNFGADPTFGGLESAATSEFKYTPPTGYLALSAANLPTPTIAKGNEHFDTLLYTTSGAKDGLSFQPDLVWIKSRDSATEHELTDSVRDVTKALSSDSTNAESTDTNGLTSFNADGFTVGADSNYYDTGGDGMVAWNWKGGSTHSHANYNATAGFSIVKWTGDDEQDGVAQTVTHHLEATPDFIIAKSRTAEDTMSYLNWIVYHKSLPSGYFLRLNTDGAQFDGTSGELGDGLIPSIGAVSVDFGSDENAGESLNFGDDGFEGGPDDYIAYLFSEVEGYSKFGSYEGNGLADGSFIFTGFRSRWIMCKSIDNSSGSSWYIYDAAREGYNVDNDALLADTAGAELTADNIDILSNGFKLRIGTDPNVAETYIFAAFAEQPFKYAAAR